MSSKTSIINVNNNNNNCDDKVDLDFISNYCISINQDGFRNMEKCVKLDDMSILTNNKYNNNNSNESLNDKFLEYKLRPISGK
jgi:hypothetical protein